jgi:hypothetical protein
LLQQVRQGVQVIAQDDAWMVERLHYYQELLHLTQWNISMGEAEKVEVNHPAAGAIFFGAASLDATMIISSRDVWDNGMKHDKEKSIVHELLHLQFSLFEPEEATAEWVLWHQTIELLARVIVDADRLKVK